MWTIPSSGQCWREPWESPEDGWQAVINEEDGLTLRLDGETVLETPLDFTYIPRKKIQDTGLMLDNRVLQKADGTEWGKILDVYHCAGAGEDSGRLELTVDWSEAAGPKWWSFKKLKNKSE